MRVPRLSAITLIAGTLALVLSSGRAFAQSEIVDPVSEKDLPNPNPVVIKNWAQLPDGRTWKGRTLARSPKGA